MATANEKYIELLKLLNNCREKLDGLCNLFVANYKTAKEDRVELGATYEEASSCHAELKQIASGGAKGSKLIIRTIKTNLNNQKEKFEEIYSRFSFALTDCMPLRKEYKSEVKACCDTYNLFKSKDNSTSSIDKGYRQQVRLIQSILNKIKSIIEAYNKEVELADEIKTSFNKTYEVAGILAGSLS